MKDEQKLNFHLEAEYRTLLELMARDLKLTMSWIVRACLYYYRLQYGSPPETRRPRRFIGLKVRFNLQFHGDKQEYLMWVRNFGCEFGPTVREILRLFFAGEFFVDFSDLNTVKRIKKKLDAESSQRIGSMGCVSAHLQKNLIYQEDEYWPISGWGNEFWRERAPKRRNSA